MKKPSVDLKDFRTFDSPFVFALCIQAIAVERCEGIPRACAFSFNIEHRKWAKKSRRRKIMRQAIRKARNYIAYDFREFVV